MAVDCRFVLEVEHSLGARELDTILQAVEAADGRPSELQSQANTLIRVFLPLVVIVSLSTALYWSFAGIWIDAILNSMAVLLVACPCALGLATPVAISQGLFRLAQMGLVSRDGALIDALAKTKKVFFDKTGTLSESSLRVIELWLDDTLPMERTHLLSSVLEAESSVPHPIARALTQYLVANDMTAGAAIEDLRLIPGQGLECRVSGAGGAHMIRVGEASLGAPEPPVDQLHEKKGKRVFVWLD